MKTCTLRWAREPNETGLRRVCQGPRGWDLYAGKEKIAYVSPRYRGFGREIVGWWFVARSDEMGVPLCNFASTPEASPRNARARAVIYVLPFLRAKFPETAWNEPTRCPGDGDYEPRSNEELASREARE